ncbi:MAG: nitroreductase family protein [Deltaproteobacteria bacterium]|nr:nitroreductase family protein [Deltaproteobacteria bacterium]
MTDTLDTLFGILRGRRSIRRFDARPVDPALLDRVLDAAQWAPSAGNRQAYRFIVVTSAGAISAMGEAVEHARARISEGLREDLSGEISAYMGNFTHFSLAPVVVVPIYRPGVDLLEAAAEGEGRARAKRPSDVDALSSVCAAIMCLLLAADAAGLGACWMTGPLVANDALREAAQVPDGWEIAAVIPVGHPAETPDAPLRRPLSRLVRRIT